MDKEKRVRVGVSQLLLGLVNANPYPSMGCRGGILNACLAYTITCGGPLMDKSVLSFPYQFSDPGGMKGLVGFSGKPKSAGCSTILRNKNLVLHKALQGTSSDLLCTLFSSFFICSKDNVRLFFSFLCSVQQICTL